MLDVAIIGGGLCGLALAHSLQARGSDWRLYEARERLGGRILSVTDDGFDLGPAWFWPDMQPMVTGLVEELGLASFPQYSDGDVLIERANFKLYAPFGTMIVVSIVLTLVLNLLLRLLR